MKQSAIFLCTLMRGAQNVFAQIADGRYVTLSRSSGQAVSVDNGYRAVDIQWRQLATIQHS